MDEPVIRRAQRADVPTIVALLADDPLGATREQVDDLARYQTAFDVVAADPGELLLVAEADGEVVATLQLSVLPGLSRGATTRGQIEGVRVAASHRRTGLGRRLVTHAIDEARRRDCGLVQLTSDRQRPEAQRFYEDLGFTAAHVGFKRSLAPEAGEGRNSV